MVDVLEVRILKTSSEDLVDPVVGPCLPLSEVEVFAVDVVVV